MSEKPCAPKYWGGWVVKAVEPSIGSFLTDIIAANEDDALLKLVPLVVETSARNDAALKDGTIGIASWVIVGIGVAIGIEAEEVKLCVDTLDEDVACRGGEALNLVGIHSAARLKDDDFIAFIEVRHDLFA